jgi:predicted RNase H-like HicB family nuclease
MAFDNKYSFEMIWSGEDGVYLSQVKELPGCIADGATPEEALQNLIIVMQEWLETANEEGRAIPAPLTLERLEKNAAVAKSIIEKQLEKRVGEAVGQILKKLSEQQAVPNIPSWQDRGYISFEEPKLAKSR